MIARWWNGRDEGLKNPWPEMAVWVQVHSRYGGECIKQLVRSFFLFRCLDVRVHCSVSQLRFATQLLNSSTFQLSSASSMAFDAHF